MDEKKDSADEAALLAAARSGDRTALQAWLGRYEAPIYRFAVRMCRDPERAKDVLQESMLAAARTLGGYRGEGSPTSWLYAIARSFCGKMRRRRVGEPASFLSVEGDDSSTGGPTELVDRSRAPDENVEAARLDRAIAEAIDALEPAQREVLVLRDVDGASAAEVAETLGISVEAVKSRLHRARLAVRARLAPLFEVQAATHPSEPCPDVVPLFSRHLEGEIDAATCAQMERHLEKCPNCRAACDSLKRTLARCRSGLGDVPDEVRADVRRALRNFLEIKA